MGKPFAKIVEDAFKETELRVEELPRIELYMDQILTLLEEGLGSGKRRPQERVVTKTMINNYTKEQLIMPVKGKKYSREQVLQLLCVLELKQTLALADVKALMDSKGAPMACGQVLSEAARLKERLRGQIPKLVQEAFDHLPLEGAERDLALSLALSAVSSDLRRVCEGIIDNRDSRST